MAADVWHDQDKLWRGSDSALVSLCMTGCLGRSGPRSGGDRAW